MAGAEINLYGIGDVDLTAMMDTLDKQRVTYQGLSLTNYDNTSLPAIASGSLVEVGGTLFKFTSEEAITGWAGVAVGVAYIKLVPAGTSPDTVTAVFTDTAPTWSDARQGWYGTVAAANHRYIVKLMKVDAATYATKDIYRGRYGERPMRSRMRATKNDAQSISNVTSTIVQYNTEDFDNLGEYDNSVNYRFTAIEAGYYYISAKLMSASVAWAVGETWEIALYKNGTTAAVGYIDKQEAATTKIKTSFVNTLLYLDATDYIDVRVIHVQGAAVNTGTGTGANYFTVHRLS